LGEIAKRLGKDRSTISREFRKYADIEKSGYGAAGYNACFHRPNCTKSHVCKGDCGRQSVKYCKLCGRCNDFCSDFEEQTCIIRMKPPYVCNGCEERNRCTLEKTLYSAISTQKAAARNISESRRGVLSTEQELTVLNELVTPLILQGLSVHQIYANNVDSMMCSEKTLYNYMTVDSLMPGTLIYHEKSGIVHARKRKSSKWTRAVT
jgi:IS30 family transposase